MLTNAHACSRMLPYSHVCSRMSTHAHVCSRVLQQAAQSDAATDGSRLRRPQRPRAPRAPGTHFTCFTGTNVQTLTLRNRPHRRRPASMQPSARSCRKRAPMPLTACSRTALPALHRLCLPHHRYSGYYVHYWYKSTNTDAACRRIDARAHSSCPPANAVTQQQSDPSARALLSGGQRHQSLRACAARQVPAPAQHSPNSPPQPPEKTGGGGEKDRGGGGENEGEGDGETEGLLAQRRRVRAEIQEMKRLLRQKEEEEEALTQTLTGAVAR
jgi:hypothetical protein